MQWEIFRCNLYSPTDDCTDKESTKCISEALYQGQADAMVSEGFADAGYASIHMDVSLSAGENRARRNGRPDETPTRTPTHPPPRQDCWEEKSPPRDPTTNELRADSRRFPSGMKALGDYVSPTRPPLRAPKPRRR